MAPAISLSCGMPAASSPGSASAKKRRVSGERAKPRPARRPRQARSSAAATSSSCAMPASTTAPDRIRPRRRRRGGAEMAITSDDRRDDHAVEDHDAQGDSADATFRIEHRGRDRDHAGERDIGQRQPHDSRPPGEAFAAGREAGREEADQRRREHDAGKRDGAETERSSRRARSRRTGARRPRRLGRGCAATSARRRR